MFSVVFTWSSYTTRASGCTAPWSGHNYAQLGGCTVFLGGCTTTFLSGTTEPTTGPTTVREVIPLGLPVVLRRWPSGCSSNFIITDKTGQPDGSTTSFALATLLAGPQLQVSCLYRSSVFYTIIVRFVGAYLRGSSSPTVLTFLKHTFFSIVELQKLCLLSIPPLNLASFLWKRET